VGRTDDGLGFIGKARALGELLHEPGAVCYALNAEGYALLERGGNGTAPMERGLRIALDADLPDMAGNLYSSLQEAVSRRNMFVQAERYYAEGMAYCEERELGVYVLCLQGWRAVTLGLLGRWGEAADISAQMLGRPGGG
jgi:hypothetical protein